MPDPHANGAEDYADSLDSLDRGEQPRVIDFDDGEISVRLDGKELRGWSYKDDAERRQKMLQAREYVEGWCDAKQQTQCCRGLAPSFECRCELERKA